MMNAAVREMKCYMDHKFHELHQRNLQEKIRWVESNLATLGPKFGELLQGNPTQEAIQMYWLRLLAVVSEYLSKSGIFASTKHILKNRGRSSRQLQ